MGNASYLLLCPNHHFHAVHIDFRDLGSRILLSHSNEVTVAQQTGGVVAGANRGFVEAMDVVSSFALVVSKQSPNQPCMVRKQAISRSRRLP